MSEIIDAFFEPFLLFIPLIGIGLIIFAAYNVLKNKKSN